VPSNWLNQQLTLSFFQNQIGQHVIRNIRKITFCGNDGDPIYCQDLLEICHWIKTINPQIQLVIITNGSHKPAQWWKSLALTLNHQDEINWSLDGWDHDSNTQYRVNSSWSSIQSGIQAFTNSNCDSYRVWAAIAFRFNQDHLEHMQQQAQDLGMDLFQLTKSTKFGSHYPGVYGPDDPLCPDQPGLVSSSHRFERVLTELTNKQRPGADLKEIFWARAHDLAQQNQHSALCLIGNKGVFVNSRGEFYPCCWTANRYEHNQQWHDLAQSRFNLWQRPFQDIMTDSFWTNEFLQFDSWECKNKCTADRLKNKEHVTEW
jgi:hypothetical protein